MGQAGGNLLIVTALLAGPAGATQVPAQPALPEWRLGATPVLSIGGEGSPATEFLRIAGVHRTTTGLVAVVNAGSSEIRVFDASGRALGAFGREGAGPGEFQRMISAGRVGDTLNLYDRSQQRLTRVLLAPTPELLGSLPITARGERGFSLRGRLADGRWLVATGVSPTFDGPPGVHRLPGFVGIIAADGTGQVHWLAELPSGAVFVHNPTGNLQQAAVGLIAFSPFLHAVASGGAAWFGESGSDSLVRLTPDGRRQTSHLPIAPRAPSAGLVAAARDEELAVARTDQSRSFTEAKLSARYLPKTLPYYESLVAGHAGAVWVQEYAGVRTATARYLVVGPDLKPLAWVPVPAGFRVSEVGAEYVAGVHQDEDGVETVRVYALTRR